MWPCRRSCRQAWRHRRRLFAVRRSSLLGYMRSGRRDLNPGSLVPQTSALNRARPHPEETRAGSLSVGGTATDAAKLMRLQARIRACRKCVGAGYLERAAPVVDLAGGATDRVLLVRQAPRVAELTTPTPFSCRGGAVPC